MAQMSKEQAVRELAELAREVNWQYHESEQSLLLEYGEDDEQIERHAERCDMVDRRIGYLLSVALGE